MTKKIYLMGKDDVLFDLYKKSIAERNEGHPENQYELVLGRKGDLEQTIQIIHYDETYDIDYLKDELKKNTELRAIVLIRPTDYTYEAKIQNLALDYPLSVLNVARQPIQTARLWEFLERCESKTLSFDWEDGDWDEF